MTVLTIRQETYDLASPWTTATGGAIRSRAVAMIEGLDESGERVAWGEGATAFGSGETAQQCASWLRAHIGQIPLEDHEACMQFLNEAKPPRAAKAAMEMAALDYQGHLGDAPLWLAVGLPDPSGRPVPFSLSAPSRVEELESYATPISTATAVLLRAPLSDGDLIVRLVQALRSRTNQPIRIDAGGAWRTDGALGVLEALAPLGVEYVVQPLEPGHAEAMEELHRLSPVPLILDQDVTDAEAVERVAGRCAGVRITLGRAGGVTETLRAILKARDQGLTTVLGGDLETPVATTAAAHLAAVADYCDFYGPTFMTNTPYQGVSVTGGQITLPNGPGLGITCRT